MGGTKNKYYVVWRGHNPGVYDTWSEAQKQILGFSGPKFKSYKTKEEAEQKYVEGYENSSLNNTNDISEQSPVKLSIAVDAACSGNPGVMEYRGVSLWDNREVFHKRYDLGTNNIGEFLAIVHALAMLKKDGINNVQIYSDSSIAIGWVRKGECRTKLEYTPFTASLFDIIRRAEVWLRNNDFRVPIVKWPTKAWGEIPADFGRK